MRCFTFVLVASVTIAANPAFARYSKPSLGSLKSAARQSSAQFQLTEQPAPQQLDPIGVYVDGRLIGRDPDPNVRATLQQEYYDTR